MQHPHLIEADQVNVSLHTDIIQHPGLQANWPQSTQTTSNRTLVTPPSYITATTYCGHYHQWVEARPLPDTTPGESTRLGRCLLHRQPLSHCQHCCTVHLRCAVSAVHQRHCCTKRLNVMPGESPVYTGTVLRASMNASLYVGPHVSCARAFVFGLQSQWPLRDPWVRIECRQKTQT
jgi:hypothetical protein